MFDNYPQKKKKYLEDAEDEAKYYEEEATISKFLRHETGKRLFPQVLYRAEKSDIKPVATITHLDTSILPSVQRP
jgi:hypothetical protein